MDARRESEPTPMQNRTTVERKSERELVITRTFNGPARLVFEAWTKPELIKRWWAPKSTGMSLLSCEADVRVGGTYRFVFGHDASKTMAFFGKYIEVTPHSRLVWTNEEGHGGEAITTVIFEEKGGKSNWTSFSSLWAGAWALHALRAGELRPQGLRLGRVGEARVEHVLEVLVRDGVIVGHVNMAHARHPPTNVDPLVADNHLTSRLAGRGEVLDRLRQYLFCGEIHALPHHRRPIAVALVDVDPVRARGHLRAGACAVGWSPVALVDLFRVFRALEDASDHRAAGGRDARKHERQRELRAADQPASVKAYSCCMSRTTSTRLPSRFSTMNGMPSTPGAIVTIERVPSSFLRVATGVFHPPNRNVHVVPSVVTTMSPSDAFA